MPKKKHNFSEETMAKYDDVIVTIPNIKLKGAANPYTSHNGHMFSFITKGGLIGYSSAKRKSRVLFGRM